MNERIFELIQSQNGVRGLLWTEEDKEEFAELIVRECASLAYDGPSGILEHFSLVEDQPVEEDTIPIPTSREQAEAMLRVANFYLSTKK